MLKEKIDQLTYELRQVGNRNDNDRMLENEINNLRQLLEDKERETQN